MTEMQRQFEEWAIRTKDAFGLPFFTMKNKQGKYFDHATEISWQAWQASRAAVVVRLPDIFDCSPDNATYYDYMYRKTEIEKALDEAGVSYE